MLSWALNGVSKLSWWYPAESSFGINASRESATMEVLKSPVPSMSLSPSFPLNFFFFFTDFSYFLLISKKKKEKKEKPKHLNGIS